MKMVWLKEHRNWGLEHLWLKLILTPSSSSCAASDASLLLLALHPQSESGCCQATWFPRSLSETVVV